MLPRHKPTKKGYGGTGIRARVKRITTAYANHYTIPPRMGNEVSTCDDEDTASRSEHKFTNSLVRGGDSAAPRHTIALIAQLGER